MVNKSAKFKLITSLLLVLMLVIGVPYVIVQENIEKTLRHPLNSSYEETGSYMIDSATILEDLDQGKIDVFMPLIGSSDSNNTPYTPGFIGSHPWSQSDYIKVAKALHQFVWKEDVRNWLIYSMFFYSGCKDDTIGLDSAKITYFKTANGFFSYNTRMIDIYPIRSGVSWGGDAKFPRPFYGWKSVDLEKLKVTADDALQLAEKIGGRDARLQVENVCTIDIILSPNTDSGDLWRITYFSDLMPTGNSIIFKIQIDPYAGNYEILDQ